MNVIITGSTGMVGKGVLLECLEDTRIDLVLIVNRSSINFTHPKLKELLISDFMELEQVKKQLTGFDACFFCAGTSAIGKSEEEYTKITFDITTHFASVFREVNPNSYFSYVTGVGTDSTEKGRSMWARVKGKTENTLINMGFKATYMFRPGYIQPMKGVKSKTFWYDSLYMIFKPIYYILKHFPSSATNSKNMGKAMINLICNDAPSQILHNKEINQTA